jgi:hypothetical protein
MQRRTLFKLGALSVAVLAVGGGSMALIQPGLEQGVLSRAGRDIFAAVGAGILDNSLPAEAGQRRTAVNGMLDRIDSLILALPPHAQAELSQLLSLLASSPGRRALAGLAPSWPQASAREVQAALQSMRLSKLALRQQAYAALHDIAAGAYFADASSWPLLGYPGPLAI